MGGHCIKFPAHDQALVRLEDKATEQSLGRERGSQRLILRRDCTASKNRVKDLHYMSHKLEASQR